MWLQDIKKVCKILNIHCWHWKHFGYWNSFLILIMYSPTFWKTWVLFKLPFPLKCPFNCLEMYPKFDSVPNTCSAKLMITYFWSRVYYKQNINELSVEFSRIFREEMQYPLWHNMDRYSSPSFATNFPV